MVVGVLLCACAYVCVCARVCMRVCGISGVLYVYVC